MKTGAKGIALIKEKEEFRARWYTCPTGYPTIGYGHVIQKGEEHYYKVALTEPEAAALLAKDLARYEKAVLRGTEAVTLTQNQFDACVCLCYNIGEAGFESSTVARRITARTSEATIREAWSRWNKGTVKGQKVTLPGLVKRRKEEADLFFSK
ncbi:lysozyme [Hymenobacter aerilatus]|uniref:Lysozyme n=1 Tax=Hymenobacter aerilatus TaxID=2932251 RepID=A0A8T9SY07_9BACT|nr:lysozyme [Hymenobacter aerilatus]UOR06745.1 lysozyme [Hymenobacter aerilatus]